MPFTLHSHGPGWTYSPQSQPNQPASLSLAYGCAFAQQDTLIEILDSLSPAHMSTSPVKMAEFGVQVTSRSRDILYQAAVTSPAVII
jgi:hypothetical protein